MVNPPAKKEIEKGYRPGCVDRKMLTDRYFGKGKATKMIVDRADHLWIHGRDHDLSQGALRNKRVAILGCGSVGGPVANLLAQSGVGNLCLVDGETMTWPNVGRHILGAESVGKFKAIQLADRIEKSYPHLGKITWRNLRVGLSERQGISDLASCDLIISAMGNWAAERFLNDWQQQSESFPPILYGWTEVHASAAHAVLVPRGSSCFQCGFDGEMKPRFTVTEWDEEQAGLKIPECGATFAPYGPAQLAFTHALIANAAVVALARCPSESRHHVWVGQKAWIDNAGGSWSPSFLKEYPELRKGGCIVERDWPKSEKCHVCGK